MRRGENTASALLQSYAMYNDPTPANIPPTTPRTQLIKPKNLAPETSRAAGPRVRRKPVDMSAT
ncbi:hypothetical protein BDK92_1115 [Micromonospora pisi]|uniref:Uncharacterized protein n=1 Tax=Micromonospora pisi TaxID=589240 RepID=A0A495JD54_9ACTN|nr:hypothetical protein BDK92_1115 [Micromonospora pisi]